MIWVGFKPDLARAWVHQACMRWCCVVLLAAGSSKLSQASLNMTGRPVLVLASAAQLESAIGSIAGAGSAVSPGVRATSLKTRSTALARGTWAPGKGLLWGARHPQAHTRKRVVEHLRQLTLPWCMTVLPCFWFGMSTVASCVGLLTVMTTPLYSNMHACVRVSLPLYPLDM